MLYQTIRVSYRGVHFSSHLVAALITCIILPPLYGRHWFSTKRGKKITQWWFKRTINILGLTIIQKGVPYKSTSLIVANHISFLDIIVIASSSPVTFLAKSTLRYWPVIGFIADRIGTIFIQRNNNRMVYGLTKSLTKALKQKKSIALFPEGTTTSGQIVKKFHSSLFQSTINAGKPVQPIALYYQRNGKLDVTAAYIDNDIFIINLVKIMAEKKTEVQITFCDLIDGRNLSRVELATTSHNLISKAIAANC